MTTTLSPRHWQLLLLALFSLSGFAGLIYESIWSHYLKLFLGHAAYAQTLVLAIFMGGMALGAWLCGKLMHRISKPLLGYVIVELVIGALGMLFHPIFTSSTDLLLDNILPGMTSPLSIELLRWSFATLLILPQTLLLGATFPLMSVGILRHFPSLPGNSIALLYFSNSLGAVIGVLISGFWLISAVGLPGTIMTAALINFLLALLVYAIAKQLNNRPAPATPSSTQKDHLLQPLLLVAMITGLSSFVYEIGWIRMLSLVLGASTHAFELMLSAFILGLALGGLWVRRHIDHYRNPLQALGLVQLLMGLFALGTVLGYNHTFDIMQGLIAALQHTNSGYFWFNLGSHAIAALVMLPVTFLAGMTLPLITYILFQRGSGEAAIGKVYAANTLGAILGVWLAVQFLLPLAGLKVTIMVGAALDLLLGLYLLAIGNSRIKQQRLAWLASLATLLVIGIGSSFDSTRMASGVFRHGSIHNIIPVFHKDGHTATIDVYDTKDGVRNISTNGKPDASVRMSDQQPPTSDEPTMVLLGGITYLLAPEIRQAAVIGMGSGISANVMLANPSLQALDIIEIEAAMVEGARLFGTHSQRVFSDPRSHIHIDDAKSYFASHHKRYDAIISEPSNPWVSGVANLFSEEFYERIRHYLNDDGYLVQWFQLYETNPQIIASILQALGNQFDDYRLYASNDADMVLVARPRGKIPELNATALNVPALRQHFERIQWFSLDDITLHEVGDRELLEPLFLTASSLPNSDFFPYVDQNAVKARFQQQDYRLLTQLRTSGLPLPGSNLMGILQPTPYAIPLGFSARSQAQQAQQVIHYFQRPGSPMPDALDTELQTALWVSLRAPACDDETGQALWRNHATTLMARTLPYVSPSAASSMLTALGKQLCPTAKANRAMFDIWEAVAKRDMPTLHKTTIAYMRLGPFPFDGTQQYVNHAQLLALQQTGRYREVIQMAKQLPATPLITLLNAQAKVALYKQQAQP